MGKVLSISAVRYRQSSGPAGDSRVHVLFLALIGDEFPMKEGIEDLV